jgi:hypothetical protein
MSLESYRALRWATLATAPLAVLIVIGSRNLSRFDAALVAYTFASLFAFFGVIYRYAVWLQRPPTMMYWKRGWQVFFKRGHFLANLRAWPVRVGADFAFNAFIWRRNWLRGATHGLLMIGCTLAAAITFPLVFGWLQFESAPGHLATYRVLVFGYPASTLPSESLLGFLVFHGLVWAALLVIPGVMLAMRRRMREEGAVALQLFTEDFLPLILLFAVSLTGLLLTVSYTWLKGYGYEFLAITHAATVILTLLWMPFGKFFHIFQRPAQIGVSFYKDVAAAGPAALCRRCGHPFASRMHIEDLIQVERELGYRYESADPRIEHYQWICPPCRRATMAMAQARLRSGATSLEPSTLLPMPVYANPGLGEGPLGKEDRDNYHG